MNPKITLCGLCRRILPPNSAGAVVPHFEPRAKRFDYFCSHECLSLLYPYAALPVRTGDMLCGAECLGVREPLKVLLNPDEFFLWEYPELLECPEDDTGNAPDAWAVVMEDPQDRNRLFLAPWTADEEEDFRPENLPFQVHAKFHPEWFSLKESKISCPPPHAVRLILGHGVWRRRQEVEKLLIGRFQVMLPGEARRAAQYLSQFD